MSETLKILIVEDEMIVSENINFQLKKFLNAQTFTADRVQDADRILMVEKPDIVLLDLSLRNGEFGISIAEKIVDQDIPTLLLIMSAYTEVKDTMDVKGKAVHTMPKPFEFKDLLLKLQDLMPDRVFLVDSIAI